MANELRHDHHRMFRPMLRTSVPAVMEVLSAGIEIAINCLCIFILRTSYFANTARPSRYQASRMIRAVATRNWNGDCIATALERMH